MVFGVLAAKNRPGRGVAGAVIVGTEGCGTLENRGKSGNYLRNEQELSETLFYNQQWRLEEPTERSTGWSTSSVKPQDFFRFAFHHTEFDLVLIQTLTGQLAEDPVPEVSQKPRHLGMQGMGW